jgi:hypothetical protein
MEHFSTEELRSVLKTRSALPLDLSRAFPEIGETVESRPLGGRLWRAQRFDPLKNVPSRRILDEIRARQKSIYGDDDRVEVIQSEDPQRRLNARSVAALIDVTLLTPVSDRESSLRATTLAHRFAAKGTQLCAREPFRDQPSSAHGTAFLIAPTFAVTAGHCINASDIHRYRVVFGFEVAHDGKAATMFAFEEIYAVQRYIAGHVDNAGADWALVELDRPVSGRNPLLFRRDGHVDDLTPVYVVGHPAGLPKKIAGRAEIRVNTHPDYFVANLDTYGGNSGSPVFNAQTHEVEGILVRGHGDFAPLGDCIASLVCPTQGCRGEECCRMGPIAKRLEAVA